MSIAIALIAGVAIGFIMGALGGGGAILALPVLVYLLGVEPHAASTSALVVVGVGAAVATWRVARRGEVAWLQAVTMAVLGIAGSWLGSLLAASVPGTTLLASFGFLLLVVAALMWRGRHQKECADAPPRLLDVVRAPRRLALLVVASVAVGVLTGFFGVGGGFLIVPTCTLVLEMGTRLAIGTSLLVICLNCLSALAIRIGHTDMPWTLTGVLTFAAILGSLCGTWLGARVNSGVLRRSFVCLLCVISLYTLGRVFL